MIKFFDRYENHLWCNIFGHWWQGYDGPKSPGSYGKVLQYCEYCGEQRVITGTYDDWY